MCLIKFKVLCLQFFLLDIICVSAAGVRGEQHGEEQGLSISPFTTTDLLSLHCSGLDLPTGVRSVSYMSVETSVEGDWQIIASMSGTDGVRLDDTKHFPRAFVTGHIQTENANTAYLTLMLPTKDVIVGSTYGCRVAFITDKGFPEVKHSELTVSEADLKRLLPPPPASENLPSEPDAPINPDKDDADKTDMQAASEGQGGGELDTTMVLVMGMVGMLVVLVTVCTVLVVLRCKGSQPPMMDRPVRRSDSWTVQDLGTQLGPLPPLPGTRKNSLRSNYNTIRTNKSMTMYEDTYDNMRYIPPWDDQDISGNSDVMNGLSRGDCGDPSLGSSRAV